MKNSHTVQCAATHGTFLDIIGSNNNKRKTDSLSLQIQEASKILSLENELNFLHMGENVLVFNQQKIYAILMTLF